MRSRQRPAGARHQSGQRTRVNTLALGAVPLLCLTSAFTLDHIPFTDVSLTVPYAAQGPGPTFNTLGDLDGVPVVEIEGAAEGQTSGNLNMTTVSVRTNMTLAQALGRWLVTGDTIVPIDQIMPPNLSEDEIKQRNEAAFVSSEATATVAAMRFLGRPTSVVIHQAIEGSAAEGKLEAGDVITAIDGVEVTEPDDVKSKVEARKPGETIALKIYRAGAHEDVEVILGENREDSSKPQLGILMTSEPADGLHVNYNLQDIGGPSAGMIFALAVIDKLSPGQLNGGRFVAGTGTVDANEAVGPVGGITHKIEAARDAGAELFLAPAANCDEAASAKAGEMKVARVSNLDEAVQAMKDFDEGREVASCAPPKEK
ncbi:YlbL family protein [Corynebacterium mayonis]|uniref:YlbL family protein n=1 Tax=Corynebacterium mayonis TaxID=3062461 RepID=UPI003CC7F14D